MLKTPDGQGKAWCLELVDGENFRVVGTQKVVNEFKLVVGQPQVIENACWDK